MTLGAYTYGSVTGVQRRVGWVVESRTFGAGTVPTTTEVEGILDQVAAEMHAVMGNAGYAIPTSASATSGAPRAAAFLAKVNEDGAAMMVMLTQPFESQPENENRPPYFTMYKDGLKLIAGRALEDMGLARQGIADLVFAGSQEDADGNTKSPLFTRDYLSYPGVRDLTE